VKLFIASWRGYYPVVVQRRHINPIMVDVVPRGSAKEKEKQGKEASFSKNLFPPIEVILLKF